VEEVIRIDNYDLVKYSTNISCTPENPNLMCYQLKTNTGGTEAVIDDNCGISKFYSIADTLADELKVTFLNQVDDAETLDWDFKYKSQLLTLHYNIFNGVSIFPQSSKSREKGNNAVMEIAKFLEKKAY
jgi:hypothetical protein